MSLSLKGFEAFTKGVILDSGKPMVLEPFQRDLVADFVDPALHEVWCVLPEASGKSTLLGIYSLYVLMAVPGSTVVLASVTMSQAGSALYRQASDAVDRSPGLARHLRTLDGRLRIFGPGRSRLEVKPSTPSTAQGAIPTLVVVDELGELPSLELATMLRGKLTKRADAKMIVVSSAGEPGSDFERVLADIRKDAEMVHRDGRHSRYGSGSTAIHEWRLEPGDDVTDWPLLKSANPLASVTEQALQDKYESPLTDQQHFTRYTGGLAEYGGDHVIRADAWDAAKFVGGVDPDPGTATRHIIGVDFASSWDAFATVGCLAFPDILLLGPATLLEPPRPGQPIPLEAMQDVLREVCDGADEVWLNPAAGSSPLQEWIATTLGVDVKLYGVSQPQAVELAEKFIAELHSGRLRHSGDDQLRAHCLNAVPRFGWDGRFAFQRPKSGRTAKQQSTRRIDALSAACLAVVGATTPPEPPAVEPFIEFIY
jgi:phage terminase large subunit-like protein